MAAMVLMLPLPAQGHAAGAATTLTPEKVGGIHELGRSVPTELNPLARLTGAFLGVRAMPLGSTGPTTGSPLTASPLSAGPLSPVTSPQLLKSFSGSMYSQAGGYSPPDTQVAMNGSYIFELVNEYGKITSTSGTTVYSTFTTQGYFGLTSTDNVGDVQVLYDQLSKRWIFSADDFTTNVEWFAVSQTSSPIGSYYIYNYVAYYTYAATFMDQPVLGVSKTMLAWDTNQFNSTTYAFSGSLLVVFNKHKLETGTVSGTVLGFSGLWYHPARQIATNGTRQGRALRGLDLLLRKLHHPGRRRGQRDHRTPSRFHGRLHDREHGQRARRCPTWDEHSDRHRR